MLGDSGILVAASSSWYATAPIPKSEQPDFVNGVVRVVTTLDPASLLLLLHRIEDDFGRVRVNRNEARVLDLDLIDYAGRVQSPETGPILPHPRAHERGFVLVPLREIAPRWRHPVTGAGIDALIRDLPDANDVKRL
jgi:2-amino-4-hydroxy-6-hydroxymethyldihydropteridine diphosphokinase